MSALAHEATLGLLQRLWIYQRERFPLVRTALLVTVFTAASLCVSAILAGRAPPAGATYVVAFVAALVFFFQLRACDEIKDADIDRRYRPERPIPRGLIALRVVVMLGLIGVPVALVTTMALDIRLVLPLALVWGWMALMTAEFFVPEWLSARPFLYLVSHMLIMPLIDLFVTACEWLPAAGAAPSGLWLFLVLSFLNGCVLEIGRKIYAPANERTGVETYSALLGPRRAILLWVTILAVAYVFLLAVGFAVGVLLPIAALGLAALLWCIRCSILFARSPDSSAQKRIDAASGIWVLLCYGAAGFVPLTLQG